MRVFNLPDLGEGLPDAEIREWYVNEGDEVKEDQPIVAMETAKALLDVPSPFTGKVTKLHGQPGDIIETGSPLISFDNGEASASVDTEKSAAAGQPTTSKPATQPEQASSQSTDAGTVVGNIEVGENVIQESATGVKPTCATGKRVKATPAVRKLAKQLSVDLTTVTPTGPAGSISANDVRGANSQGGSKDSVRQGDSSQGSSKDSVNQSTSSQGGSKKALAEGFEHLHGVARAMAFSMAKAAREVAPVTIVDDADIDHFDADVDITVRLTRAVQTACKAEPVFNAHFDGEHMAINKREDINLALAVDTKGGLYAPVIKDIANKSDKELRACINDFKTHAKQQDFPPEMLHDATITLSNFGVFVGRYANPMIVPPTVAIVGIGKLRFDVVALNGKPTVHKIMPLSLTFDHRAATGGEAARFLAALIEALSS